SASAIAVAPSQSILGGVQVTTAVGGQLDRVVSGFGLASLVLNPGPGSMGVTVSGAIGVPVNVQAGGLPTTILTFNDNGSSTAILGLGAGTLREAGFQPVSFAGVTVLNVNAGGAAAAVFGTTGPDDLAYAPSGAEAVGVAVVAGSGLTANFAN